MAEYTVRSGDSLANIAQAHGIATGALIRANPQIEDPRLVFPGQVINIPEPVPSQPDDSDDEPVVVGDEYLVRSGDSFRKIAALYGLPTKELIDANPQIPNPDLLRPGEAPPPIDRIPCAARDSGSRAGRI